MNPVSQKYKKQYAYELVRIARGDLQSSGVLAASSAGRKENMLYLVHQAIENSLNAALCYLELPVLHTHDLDALASMLPASNKPPHAHQLGALTQYATSRRYLEGYEILDATEIQNALLSGEEVVAWAEALIK